MAKWRYSWYGLLQAFADALKLLLKEYVSPTQANIVLFFLGPIITLIFALLGYAVIPYGPGLMLLDYNLGILYMLAMSSLATYGILLAGYGIYNESIKLFNYINLNISCYKLYCLVVGCIVFFCLLLFLVPFCTLACKELYLSYDINNKEINSMEFLLYFVIFYRVKANSIAVNLQIRKFQTTRYLKSIKTPDIYDLNTIKSLHVSLIKELYKDRKAPVIPFNRESILASCYNCLDKNTRSEFLKEWGSKSCIYIIEYKYDPLIYYIGRTTLFKRRFNSHLKADSSNKLHTFLSLIGWEHFIISIIEITSVSEQGMRENYYLQKYLPLLNTTFSCSFCFFFFDIIYIYKWLEKKAETEIYETLVKKLSILKGNDTTYVSGKYMEVYVYEIMSDHISNEYNKYRSIIEASKIQKIARGTISRYIDTNVPFRGKLYYTKPITDMMETFNLVKNVSNDLKINSNIATNVWAYDAKTLELIKGSPFFSKTQASKAIGISRNVINYFIDTNKAEGVKETYLYTRPLTDAEIKNLMVVSQNLQLGNKVEVWVYNAKTLELVNNSPFPSLLYAANYFNVNYRTITIHLDTKLASMQNKTWVYFFKNQLSSKLIDELKKDKPTTTTYARSEIWVYKVDVDGVLTLIPNLKSRRSITHDITKRYMSTKLNKLNPVVSYSNSETQKAIILQENKGKSGVYRWINLVNGLTYVGSAVDLTNRFNLYYNFNHLTKVKMVINRALNKYKHSKFSLEILEYCEPSNVISREQYYIDLLNPEYNVLKIAGSSLGFKHSEETLQKMKENTLKRLELN